jgi:tetratricopeptide (TPR) repeat protein
MIHPAVGPRLSLLLKCVFLLFALLAVNSLYLTAITVVEQISGGIYQDYFFLVMFLLHLLLGLALLIPVMLFGLLHIRNVWQRPNRYAIRAGIALYISALLLLLSGLLLTRFSFFEINDPAVRRTAYWLHVLLPLIVAWLFVLHRLAGPRLRWRSGGYWAATAVIFVAVMLVLQLHPGRAASEVVEPYAPALVKLQGNGKIPAEHLMTDARCAECHGDIAEQAAMSMHRFSSFNNPAYRFSIEEARKVLLKRDGEVRVARLCAVCHDQVPLFSGRFDDPDYDLDSRPDGQAGITCIGCHGISEINSPRGNGSYTFTDPPRYPFAFSDNEFLQAVNHQLIKAKPALHKKTLLKPLHRSAIFCSTCHKVSLPYELNHYRWLRGQDHYDSFLLSGVSGHRVDSFYYPPRAVSNCAHCHMPLTLSEDPAARDFGGSGQRSVHNHLFPAANTGVPHLLNRDMANESRRSMMQNAARVDIFGIKEGGEIDGELHAPLRPKLPMLMPGRRYLVETVVRTLNIGHQLTQGTTDSNELWLDIQIMSGDRLIGRSGGQNARGEVDPWSWFLNTYLLDREGIRIERRNAQDIFVALYDHQIPPGAAAVAHYTLELPADIQGPVSIEVKLQYRKFDSRLLRHMKGMNYTGNDLPITTLASDQVVLPLAGGGEVPDQPATVALWERWNDYGISLLQEGNRGSSKGELRQAEAAFMNVEQLKPARGALNLARVYFKEGRLEETATALRRAARGEPPAPSWTVAWYSALVEREYGNLDSAITLLEDIANTRFTEARDRGFDFSKDIRVLNELGRVLYERSRRERGASRKQAREALLQRALTWLEKVVAIDPEDVKVHYNLALVHAGLGDSEAAARHRELHDRYRRDDHAVEQAVARHRRANPAADHAAEAIAIYDLQRPGAYESAETNHVALRAD